MLHTLFQCNHSHIYTALTTNNFEQGDVVLLNKF